MTAHHQDQQGMVLVVSLLILLIIMLLGLSSMRSAGLEERMSGNQFDKNYTFEAAEAALREAEALAATPPADFTPKSPDGSRVKGMIASGPASPISPRFGTPPAAKGNSVGEDTMLLR